MPSFKEKYVGHFCSTYSRCTILQTAKNDEEKARHLAQYKHLCDHAICPDFFECEGFKSKLPNGDCVCPLKHVPYLDFVGSSNSPLFQEHYLDVFLATSTREVLCWDLKYGTCQMAHSPFEIAAKDLLNRISTIDALSNTIAIINAKKEGEIPQSVIISLQEQIKSLKQDSSYSRLQQFNKFIFLMAEEGRNRMSLANEAEWFALNEFKRTQEGAKRIQMAAEAYAHRQAISMEEASSYAALLQSSKEDLLHINTTRQKLFDLHCQYSPDPTYFPNTLYHDLPRTVVTTEKKSFFTKKVVQDITVPKTETQVVSLQESPAIFFKTLLVKTSLHRRPASLCSSIDVTSDYTTSPRRVQIPADFNQGNMRSIVHAQEYSFMGCVPSLAISPTILSGLANQWASNSSLIEIRNFVTSGALQSCLTTSYRGDILKGLTPVPQPPDFLSHTLINFPFVPLPIFYDFAGRYWAFLFHGTNDCSNTGILDAGFYRDTYPSSHGQMYGPGIYFTSESCKASQYTSKISTKSEGTNPRLLFVAVCLGRRPYFQHAFGPAPNDNFTSVISLRMVGNHGSQQHNEFIVKGDGGGAYHILFEIAFR